MDLEITTAAALRGHSRSHSRGYSSPEKITALPSNRTVNTSIDLINTSIVLMQPLHSWPLNCKLGGVNPKREFTQVGKGLLGMGSRPAARGRKEREFHKIVSPRGVTKLDST